MTPQEGLAYLAALSPSHIKMGLDRVRDALERLGNPQLRVPALHVAGTNGKGSTCAIAASCLRIRYRTGLYTSPHLVRPNERIQIDGEEIDDETFGRRIAEVLAALGAHELTYFEFITVVAFWHFAQERVDIAVLETGLGGRLDATTACVPLVTCITSIDFDHQEYLGHTLEAIASEKAGIVKPGVPLISSRQPAAALAALQRAAGVAIRVEGKDFNVEPQSDGCLKYRGVQMECGDLCLGLKGPHQRQNLAVALACLESLAGFPLSTDDLKQGVRLARWPGRFEIVGDQPLVVLDGAHNPAGVRALVGALEAEVPRRPIHLVFGVVADKDSEPMMRALFPRAAKVYLTPVGSPRSKDPKDYEALARQLAADVALYSSAGAALAAACQGAPKEGVIVVAGSLFLIGQLRPQLVDSSTMAVTLGRL